MIFSKSAKNRLKIFSLIAIAATIIFFFIYNNLQKNVVYFYAPQEIKNLTNIKNIDYFNDDKYNYIRKKILDAGNDAIRNIDTSFKSINISLK
mgnify:CR=1 FL=1